MPLPALAALLPYLPALAATVAGGVGGLFGGRSKRQPQGEPQGQSQMGQFGSPVEMGGAVPQSGWFGSQPGRFAQVPRGTQQQQAGQEQLLGMGLGQLQGLGGFDFGPVREQAMKSFHEQMVPSIAERFSSMGEGGQTTGAFQRELSGGAGNLLSQLAALEQQSKLQQGQFGAQLSQMGMQSPFETTYTPSQPSGMEELLGGLAGGASQMLPFLLSSLFGR